MPVTFKVAEHKAEPAAVLSLPVEKLIQAVAPEQYGTNFEELLRTSISEETHPFVLPLPNGFVSTVIHAYSAHRNLTIRPDDVWMAILCQFQLYVNANAEALRSLFVEHEGTKELIVTTRGTRYTVDFGALANQMSLQLHERVKDKDFVRWAVPHFSTTTVNDTVVYSVFLMATLKSYFSFTMRTRCGIPQVTLAGERSDWVEILSRLDKLSSFGEQPTAWMYLLRPICLRFIASFDTQTGIVDSATLDFWSKVAHYHSHGSGRDYLSGWITAFCVWDKHGGWQGPEVRGGLEPTQQELRFPTSLNDVDEDDVEIPRLILDGRPYPRIDRGAVPPGYATVDVKVDDDGEVIPCEMISGHVGMHIEDLHAGVGHSVRPASAWFIYAKKKTPSHRPRKGYARVGAGSGEGMGSLLA